MSNVMPSAVAKSGYNNTPYTPVVRTVVDTGETGSGVWLNNRYILTCAHTLSPTMTGQPTIIVGPAGQVIVNNAEAIFLRAAVPLGLNPATTGSPNDFALLDTNQYTTFNISRNLMGLVIFMNQSDSVGRTMRVIGVPANIGASADLYESSGIVDTNAVGCRSIGSTITSGWTNLY
jgi:hypothetical protein